MPVVIRRPYRRRRNAFLYTSRSLTFTPSGGLVVGGSAPLEFGSTAAANPDLQLLVDWDGDGDWDDALEDISSYIVEMGETLTGRNYASLLTGDATPGRLSFVLDNEDNRFTPFNAASPLYGLAVPGRRVRLLDSSASTADPMKLTRDRFGRSDGVLGDEEMGLTWTNELAALLVIESGRAVPGTEGSLHIATVDVGEADYFVQALIPQIGDGDNRVGIVYRYVDSSNYSAVIADVASGVLSVLNVVAGVADQVSRSVELYSGMSVGVLAEGSSAVAYLDGVPLITTTGINTSAEKVGLLAEWDSGSTRPELDNFEAWDGIPAEVEGIFWTGRLKVIKPELSVGALKRARLEADGPLADAALARVTPPVSVAGRKTGLLVGAVLSLAGQLRPPGPLQEGDITTGIFVASEADALSHGRLLEEPEFGFLHETQEGYIGFQSRSHRASVTTPEALFSDASGAQFGYRAIVEQDWITDIFNRVQAGISPYSVGAEDTVWEDAGPYLLESGESVDLVASPSSIVAQYTGHTRNVDPQLAPAPVVEGAITQAFTSLDTSFAVDMPATVNADDLLLMSFACEYASAIPSTPSGWTRLKSHGYSAADLRIVVYAKKAAGTEDGTQVTITTASSVRAVATVHRISNWAEDVPNGIAVESESGLDTDAINPPEITWAWGQSSTLVLAAYATGTGNNTSGYPSGYSGDTYIEAGTNVNLATAYKQVVNDNEDPGAFSATASRWLAATIAIRGPIPGGTEYSSSQPAGSSGRFTIAYETAEGGTEQAHSSIAVTGLPVVQGDAQLVQVDDETSQDKYGVRTYRQGSQLFRNTTDAQTYASLVLSRYKDPRPVVSITFQATLNAPTYALAKRLRVGSRIRLVANNTDARGTGFGIDEDFFIESIHHRFGVGVLHEITYALSPASVTDA